MYESVPQLFTKAAGGPCPQLMETWSTSASLAERGHGEADRGWRRDESMRKQEKDMNEGRGEGRAEESNWFTGEV